MLRTDRYQTGVYFVTHDKRGHHFLHYRANSAAAMYAPSDVPEAAIKTARMLYCLGISQGISTSACDAVFEAIDVAVRNGVAVAYDTNYRPRLWPPARAAAVMHAAMAHADYAMPGQEDVSTLTGLTDPDKMLDFYLAPGLQGRAAEDGRGGVPTSPPPDARVLIPAHKVEPVDATGAGDTFCGSFLARLLAGDDPQAAGTLRRRGGGVEVHGLRGGRTDPDRRTGMGGARSFRWRARLISVSAVMSAVMVGEGPPSTSSHRLQRPRAASGPLSTFRGLAPSNLRNPACNT